MKLSVLIASHVSRVAGLVRVAELLSPVPADAEVVVLWNRGRNIGDIYRDLVAEARGEYMCFVDDDDRVAPHYLPTLLGAVQSGPDYVGFRVEVNDFSPNPINRRWRRYEAEHSLRNRGWSQQGNKFFRDVTHLNPIRTDIARRVPFPDGRSLDHDWAKAVRPLVKSEVFVDDVLYFYDYDATKSVRPEPDSRRAERPTLPAGFRYHPNSDGGN